MDSRCITYRPITGFAAYLECMRIKGILNAKFKLVFVIFVPRILKLGFVIPLS